MRIVARSTVGAAGSMRAIATETPSNATITGAIWRVVFICIWRDRGQCRPSDIECRAQSIPKRAARNSRCCRYSRVSGDASVHFLDRSVRRRTPGPQRAFDVRSRRRNRRQVRPTCDVFDVWLSFTAVTSQRFTAIAIAGGSIRSCRRPCTNAHNRVPRTRRRRPLADLSDSMRRICQIFDRR
jgi:hypothetical protein